MAMNYVEAAQLARNTWFVERVGVAISTYTNYLLNAALEDPLYNAKISVATKLASQSSVVLNTLMFTLAGDASGVVFGSPESLFCGSLTSLATRSTPGFQA